MPAEILHSEGASLETALLRMALAHQPEALDQHRELFLTIRFAQGSHLMLLDLFILDKLSFICNILGADLQLFK